jgi:hypothetical protein
LFCFFALAVFGVFAGAFGGGRGGCAVGHGGYVYCVLIRGS